MKDKIIGLS